MAYNREQDLGHVIDGKTETPNEPTDWESLLEGVPTGTFSVDEILEEFGREETEQPQPESAVLQTPAQEPAPRKKPLLDLSEKRAQQDQAKKTGAGEAPEPTSSEQDTVAAEGTGEAPGTKPKAGMESKVIALRLPVTETKADSADGAPQKRLKGRKARKAAKAAEEAAFDARKVGQNQPDKLEKDGQKPEGVSDPEDSEESDLKRIRALFRQLSDQADDYAKTMYEEEQEEAQARRPHAAFLGKNAPDGQGSQTEPPLSPWDDTDAFYEEEEEPKPRRKWRWIARLIEGRTEPEEDQGPERFPSEMAEAYKKRIGRLRLRAVLVFFIGIVLGYVAFAQQYNLPFPGGGANRFSSYLSVSVALACMAAVLGLDVIRDGFRGLFHMKADATLLAAVSILASIADGVSLLFWQIRTETLPFCVISVFSLFFAMWGTDLNHRTRRMIYRTASVEHPYLVTKDSGKWDEGDCFTKHPGPIRGFVNQVEAPDGAQRVYRRMAPLLLLACLLFALLASLGRPEKGPFLWSFSALTAASASFSACISYATPWSKLTKRLVKIGAVLAGWRGVSAMAGKSGIILTDTDLFPPGSVVISGMNNFGRHSMDNVVSYTASVVKEAGCGLEKVFHTLLRSQGTIYRRVEELEQYDQGGFSAIIRGEQVLVGSAAFLQAADIHLAPGLSVRNAVFCAIEGELAGIFALKYTLNPGVNGALHALFHSKLAPVLATRDFNLTPSMLSGRFKLNFEQVEFPNGARRMQLSDPRQAYDLPINALLFREGLTPFVDAVVGGRRLHRATLVGNFCSVIGSVTGILLAFYLTYVQAFQSISAVNLLIFMLMWLVPGILASRGVNRY